MEWTYVGALLSQTTSGDLGPSRVVERPKVIYNKSTGQYVMYMHIDSSDYSEAKVGVATGSSVCGKYTYLQSFQPLGFQSRDIGLFQDDDGSGYLLTEDVSICRSELEIGICSKLTVISVPTACESTSCLTTTSPSPPTPISSQTTLRLQPCSSRMDDTISSVSLLELPEYHRMIDPTDKHPGSHLSGWSPNDNVYTTTTNLSTGWSSWATFATVGSNTYTSQTNYILPITSSSAMYMGDRWVSTNLMRSTYVWLPLVISGTSVTMSNYVNWIVNVATGAMTAGPSETWYEGEAATLANGAVAVSCTGCSGTSAAGYIGGSSGGTAYFPAVSSTATTRTTLRFKYENGNTAQRFAKVTCNGGTAQQIAFLPSDDGNTPASSSVNCNLTAGSTNTVLVAGLGDGTYGPDIDRIAVPVS